MPTSNLVSFALVRHAIKCVLYDTIMLWLVTNWKIDYIKIARVWLVKI